MERRHGARLVLCALLAAAGRSAAAAPIAYDQTVAIDPVGRIIGSYSIGHGSQDETIRKMGWGIATRGWQQFVDAQIDPALAAGIKRFNLHNPFGISPDVWAMQFDQYLDALEDPDTPMATVDFAQVWRPITSMPGIEVIGYIGSPRLDADQVALEGDLTAWWDRAWRCVQPLIDAGMSIGLDAAAPAEEHSLTTQLAQALKARGIRVYIEARPWRHNPVWKDYPFIILDPYYYRSDPLRHSDSQNKMSDHEVNEEIVRMIRLDQEDSNFTQLKDRLLAGHTATVYPNNVILPSRGNMSLAQLLEFINLPHYPTWIVLRGQDPGGGQVSFRVVAGPRHGTLTFPPIPSVKVLYTANAGYSGHDSFQVVAVNAAGEESAPATVRVAVYSQTGQKPPPAPPTGLTAR